MFLISPVFVQVLDTILIYQYYPDVFWISYSEEKSIGLHKKKRNTAMDVPVAQLLIRAVGLQIHVNFYSSSIKQMFKCQQIREVAILKLPSLKQSISLSSSRSIL